MIIMLQETRKTLYESPSYSVFNKLRDNNPKLENKGGGLATLIHKKMTARDMNQLIPQVLNELEI